MSVIVEFSIPDEEFLLGAVLAPPPPMTIELERLVPTGSSIIPFLWVRGEDFESFEGRVSAHEAIGAFEALDRLEDWVLYRTQWAGDPFSLLHSIEESDGAILEAEGNDGWSFRLRFPNHDALSTFYNLCTHNDIAIHIDRSYTLTEKNDFGRQLGLSQEQRAALVLALRTGYFETPRRGSLETLAEELDISEQAVSDRIRRGNRTILESVLLSSAASLE